MSVVSEKVQDIMAHGARLNRALEMLLGNCDHALIFSCNIYEVSVGKVGEYEVDFVAGKNNALTYYQVTTSKMDESVRERELRPLHAIKDNYPKVIITADKPPSNDYDGI